MLSALEQAEKQNQVMGKTSRRSSLFSVSLPATSANLGPGFDAAALAFDLHLKVTAQSANEFSIVAKGRDSEICGKVENNLILSTYREVLESANKPVVPLALKIDNQAPIGKGCGSSASARLAGIALADHFGKLRWSDSKIVGEASRREHHPDNAAACWMGGVAVARMSGESEAQVARIILKGSGLCFLPCSSNRFRPKKRARCCRPIFARRRCYQYSELMLLVAAFVQGRPTCWRRL